MKVGVSGPGGFVGQALVRRLRGGGHEVIPIVRTATGAAGELVTGDLAAAAVPDAPPVMDVLIHLAARTHVGGTGGEVEEAAFRATNVDGTRAMLTLGARAGARRFVFLSSIKVNGEQTDGRAFTEHDPPRPEDAYGRSKLAAEELVRAEADAAGMEFVVLRPPLIYGAGQKGNLRALAAAVRRGLPLPFGRARNRRSLVHVDNLADLIAVAAEHPRAPGRVLMADDGTQVSTAQLARAMAAGAGRSARLLPLPVGLLTALARMVGRGDQIRRLFGDLEVDGSATRALLGWTPPLPPVEALTMAGAPVDHR